MRMEQVDKYSKLKTQAEKTAYLDKMIDERMARREERSKSMSAEDKEKWAAKRAARRGRGPSLSRVKNRVETGDPKEQAKMSQFHIDMRARMKERKISRPSGRSGGRG